MVGRYPSKSIVNIGSASADNVSSGRQSTCTFLYICVPCHPVKNVILILYIERYILSKYISYLHIYLLSDPTRIHVTLKLKKLTLVIILILI